MATTFNPIKVNSSIISGQPAKDLVEYMCKVVANDFTPEERLRRIERKKELAKVKIKMRKNGNPWGI